MIELELMWRDWCGDVEWGMESVEVWGRFEGL